MVGVVGIAQSLSSRAVELQPQRCGPKINSYDRSLTAQRPSAVVLLLFQHAGEIHGWMQGRPGERAAETGRVESFSTSRASGYTPQTMAPFTESPRERFTAGASWASVPCDVTPVWFSLAHRPAAVPVAAAVMVPKPNPNLPQWPRFNTRMGIAAQHRPRY